MGFPNPPQNQNQLFTRTKHIVENGPYELPNEGFGGSGGPGMYLEHLLGLTVGNRDIPDSFGWEVKSYSKRTNFITLFHKEPNPSGITKLMVKHYGWRDNKGRLSFRHTISGSSDRFLILYENNKIIVLPKGSTEGPIAYWTEDDILGAAGAKLRRLLLVRYSKLKDLVNYDQAEIYETLTLSKFIDQVVNGTIKIDFDAREKVPGSNTLRNHGTKFRVSPKDIHKLYAKTEDIC